MRPVSWAEKKIIISRGIIFKVAFCASTFVSFQPIFEDEMKHINTDHYICIWAFFIIITFLLTSSFQTHKQAVTFITYFLSQLLFLFFFSTPHLITQ